MDCENSRVQGFPISAYCLLGMSGQSWKVPTNYVMYICLSACLHVSLQLPLNRFPWNLILRTSMKICWHSKLGSNWEKNIRHSTQKPKYILLLLPTLNHHKALSSNEMVSGTGWMRWYKTQMCHNIPLHIHCQQLTTFVPNITVLNELAGKCKWPWPHSMYYSSNCRDSLRKTTG